MRLVVSLLILLLVGCPASPVETVYRPESGLDDALNATVALLIEGRSYCAGVIHDAYVLTAAHCVEEDEDVHVGIYPDFDASKRKWRADYTFMVIHRDAVQDLAILAPTEVFPYPGAAELSPYLPQRGERAVAVGHPLGLPYTVTEGIISVPRREGFPYEGMVWTQFSAPVSAGNSGGPVFNRYGEILCIVSFRMVSQGGTQPHLGGCVHIDNIRRAIPAPRPATQ